MEVAAEELVLLHRRSEGWAAALQMAALSLRGSRDPARVARALDTRSQAAAGYFVSEVLEQQSPEMVQFMLGTSVLGPLTEAACASAGGTWRNVMAIAVIVSGSGALNGWTMICAEMPLAAANDDLFRSSSNACPGTGARVGIVASTVLASIAMIIDYLGSSGAWRCRSPSRREGGGGLCEMGTPGCFFTSTIISAALVAGLALAGGPVHPVPGARGHAGLTRRGVRRACAGVLNLSVQGLEKQECARHVQDELVTPDRRRTPVPT